VTVKVIQLPHNIELVALWGFKYGYQHFQVATERTQDPAYRQVKPRHCITPMSQKIDCDREGYRRLKENKRVD
jgi:hypothetical protein